LTLSFECSVPQAVPLPHVKVEEVQMSLFCPIKCEVTKFILSLLLFMLNNLCLVSLMVYN